MSFNRLASSFVTKLMAVPFLPKRPERPILRIKRNLNNLPMQVIFSVRRKIVVDDQGHLLHIKTASPNIGSNQNSRLSSSEFFCNRFSFLLRHAAMHGAYLEICIFQLLGQPVHLEGPLCRERHTLSFVLQKMTAWVIVSVS